MILYRCMYCGSPNVSHVTVKDGYSMKKGIGASILLGPVGMVAGIDSKEKKVYRCHDCGQESTTPMNSAIKNCIDEYLNDPVTYRSMLETTKKKYRNIEWEVPSDVVLSSTVNTGYVSSDDKIKDEVLNNVEYEDKFELADAIWEYYVKTKIPYMSLTDIERGIKARGYSNFDVAMKVLEERGLVTLDDDMGCTFYSNVEDIKNNIKKYKEMELRDKKFPGYNEVLYSSSRLKAIKKFLSSNSYSRPLLKTFSPLKDGGVIFTDSFMLFVLNCDYLPFDVSFSKEYEDLKEDYLDKYDSRIGKIIDGDYPATKKNFTY